MTGFKMRWLVGVVVVAVLALVCLSAQPSEAAVLRRLDSRHLTLEPSATPKPKLRRQRGLARLYRAAKSERVLVKLSTGEEVAVVVPLPLQNDELSALDRQQALASLDAGLKPHGPLSQNRVEIWRSTKAPFHTWVHFPRSCNQLINDFARKTAGCPTLTTSVLRYQNVGFTRSMDHPSWPFLKRADPSITGGAIAVEGNRRPHALWQRIINIPEACARVLLAKVLNEFLQARLTTPRVVDYSVFDGGSRAVFSCNDAYTTSQAARTSTGTMQTAVCWTFTSRFINVAKQASLWLTTAQKRTGCQDPASRAFINNRIYSPSDTDDHRKVPPSAGFLLINRLGYDWSAGVLASHDEDVVDTSGLGGGPDFDEVVKKFEANPSSLVEATAVLAKKRVSSKTTTTTTTTSSSSSSSSSSATVSQ